MIIGKLIAIIIGAYLLGAIPFGVIIGKLLGKIDITKYGSGSVGGTNVLRSVGTKAGAIVMSLDLAKGAVAVLLAKVIFDDSILLIAGFPVNWQIAEITAALIVMLGHNWSIFIKFRGGKGVAAYFGGWLVIFPAAGLFGGIILLITALRTKYMSMGSIIGALAILCLLIILTVLYGLPPFYLVYSLVTTTLIVYQHRSNINRLQTGTELKLGDKAKKLD